MVDLRIPCYGGPKDGSFYPIAKNLINYRKFTVRTKTIWLWKPICVEYLDFDILEQASLLNPKDYDLKGEF